MKSRNLIMGIAAGLVVLLLAALLLGGSLWGRNYYHHGPGMMWDSGFGGGMYGFGMGILMVLFWVGLIALAIWLVRVLFPQVEKRSERPSAGEPNAREILDRRYARGEISREEYDLKKDTLARY